MQVFLGIVVIFSLHELRINYRKKGVFIPITMLIFGGLLYLVSVTSYRYLSLVVIFAAFVVISADQIFKSESEGAIQKIATSLFSMLYISEFISMLYQLRLMDQGREIVLSLLLITWLTDTAAYIIGVSFGRHRGVVKVSPKKSLEGYIGSIIFCFLGSLLLVKIFSLDRSFIWMLTVASGLFGQYGDLFESLIKRDLKIKDSSRILSEHGGFLDRFDSLLFAAPALYLLIKISGRF